MLSSCGLDRIQSKAKGACTVLALTKRKGFTCTILANQFPWLPWSSHILLYIWNCQAFYWSMQHGNTEHQALLYFLVSWRVLPLSAHLWTHWTGFRHIKMFRDLTPQVLFSDHFLGERRKQGTWLPQIGTYVRLCRSGMPADTRRLSVSFRAGFY